METKRAQNLEALETFIRAQRALLERTQTDITRLQKLRSDVVAQPAALVSDLSNQLDASSFRLSDQVECQPLLPQKFDWDLYEGHDPTALQTLARDTRQAYIQHHNPSPHQHSPLSDLQKFVKEARQTIVDPVLSWFATLLESDPDGPEPESDVGVRTGMSAEELKREREREKLRELKKRRISGHSGLGLPSTCDTFHHLGRAREVSGVFVRRDVEDENEEVDVDLSLDHDLGDAPGQSSAWSTTPMQVDSPSGPSTLSQTVSPHAIRVRRPSTKLQAAQSSSSTSTTKSKSHKATTKKRKRDPSSGPESELEPEPIPASKKHISREHPASSKPKSETYKQAWSVSEQHLLEQLLEQIPDGAKNRWQKISRAMDGKRTPRQVASRVQKYFEKLKRFGIGTDVP